MNFRSVSLNLTRRFRQIFFVCRLLFVVEPNQIFSRTNNLTFQTRKTVLSKEVFVIQRGKKKYQHFLPPVNHLNQRKSPSALLVSNEIETDFFSSSFPPKSREVPEVADLSIVCGWGGVGCGSLRELGVFALTLQRARYQHGHSYTKFSYIGLHSCDDVFCLVLFRFGEYLQRARKPPCIL